MKIGTYTGIASKQDEQIQKSIQNLIVTKNGTAAGFVDERISVTLKLLSGDIVSVPLSKIKDVGTFSQFESGYMLKQVLAGGNVQSEISIKLTRGATIALQGNEYVSVELSNLDPASSYELFGFELTQSAREIFKYTANTIPASADGIQREFTSPANAVALYIKNNDILKSIRLFGNNGKEVTYTPLELRFIAREINGMTEGPDKLIEGDAFNQTLAGGATDWFYLPMSLYKGFELTTVGGIELPFVQTNVVGY
jgi:hypothetical protein